MKVLGFRSDPTAPRYAVVDGSTLPLTLINADSESRLRFPADCSTEAAQVTWLYREFERLFHMHPDIIRVVIKKGEFHARRQQCKARCVLPRSVAAFVLRNSQQAGRHEDLCVTEHTER
jgi:hypothetical protein